MRRRATTNGVARNRPQRAGPPIQISRSPRKSSPWTHGGLLRFPEGERFCAILVSSLAWRSILVVVQDSDFSKRPGWPEFAGVAVTIGGERGRSQLWSGSLVGWVGIDAESHGGFDWKGARVRIIEKPSSRSEATVSVAASAVCVQVAKSSVKNPHHRRLVGFRMVVPLEF